MIDTTEQTCKACGKPLIQIAGRGHRRRQYCNDLCRQRAHRKQQEQETPQARIEALEKEIERLQGLLNVEERYRTDVEVRHFKAWIRRHPQAHDFFKRFLNDTRLPQHTSRAMYMARLKQYGYSAEDITLFEETWKDMLFSQS